MRENNAYANKTWKYYYDNAGNITMRDEYAYTTGTLPASPQSFVFYDYSTGTWGDMLTSYNGTTISYDAIGNPTNWRNALGLMWSGRQLTYMSIDGLDEGLGASYNADGIRTKKTYWDENSNQTFHEYVLDGSKIVKETVSGSSSHTLYYYYDESGVAGFELNGVTYYYLKNIQGDVINILNSSGQIVVTYTYDAWGKVLSVTGSLAGTVGYINPFRYRGYYYDTETGFYYLQTRYYDPELGRFLNADSIIGANGDIQGYNVFAYCNNNPVMYIDTMGCSRKNIIGAFWTSPVSPEEFRHDDPFGAYGTYRSGGRRHNGVDFYPIDSGNQPYGYDGTPKEVFAMDSGVVIAKSDSFYAGTGALYVLHGEYMVIYGELERVSGIHEGSIVHQGEKLGTMKRSNQQTLMLHLEIYRFNNNVLDSRTDNNRINPTFTWYLPRRNRSENINKKGTLYRYFGHSNLVYFDDIM